MIAIFLALFSVPVFAVGTLDQENMSEPVYVYTKESISINTATNLIHDLNVEFDRLTANGYTHDDYDGLSESGTNLIINAVLPSDSTNLSDTEVREYLAGRSYLVDELEKYAAGLENDSEKAVFFHNAAWYANELVHAD